jgi:hypothetical protein
MTYGTWNMGGFLYIMIGCIAWIVIYLPTTQFLYLTKIVKDINKKFWFTLYNTAMACLPVIALIIHYLIIGAYNGIWLSLVIVWCEICGLIVLKGGQNEAQEMADAGSFLAHLYRPIYNILFNKHRF